MRRKPEPSPRAIDLASALRVVAEHHESSVVEIDFETEGEYRVAVRAVRVHFATPTVDVDALAAALSLRLSAVAPAATPATRSRHRSLVGHGPVTPDAFVDQWSGLVPHDVFLRLAGAKHFHSTRVGQSVMARWGDVQAALATLGEKSTAAPRDALDEIRDRLGLVPKKGGG